MNPDAKLALRSAAESVIADWAAKGCPVDSSLRWAFTRENGGLRGQQVEIPSPRLDYLGAVEPLSAQFGELMRRHHPEHIGDIASDLGVTSKLTAGAWVRAVVRQALDGTQVPTDEQLSTIVSRVETIIDEPDYDVVFMAPLHRFRMAGPDIVLSNGVVLRCMTEEELGDSAFYRDGDAFIREYCVCCRRKVRKHFGPPPGAPVLFSEVMASFDQVILALRSIRSGPVDFGMIFGRSAPWNPISTYFGMGRPLSSPAMGLYDLSEADAALVVRRHDLLRRMHAVLSVAASRLFSASTRSDPRDRIIDAAIGLEALLLADTGDTAYRGELRFRFSLNYSMLSDDKMQREQEFIKARDIYDLRSAIAHGAHVDHSPKVAGQRLALGECADLACEMLRQVFDRFLESPESPDCCRTKFWRQRYFGLA